jgi:hypothetical protein
MKKFLNVLLAKAAETSRPIRKKVIKYIQVSQEPLFDLCNTKKDKKA